MNVVLAVVGAGIFFGCYVYALENSSKFDHPDNGVIIILAGWVAAVVLIFPVIMWGI